MTKQKTNKTEKSCNEPQRQVNAMVRRILNRFEWYRYWQWEKEGKPMIEYNGYNCGLCGKWVDEPFEIPKYKSDGKWWDTWGICPNCLSA